MKKSYAAPTLIPSGTVVRTTLGGSNPNPESPTEQLVITGGAGYYL